MLLSRKIRYTKVSGSRTKKDMKSRYTMTQTNLRRSPVFRKGRSNEQERRQGHVFLAFVLFHDPIFSMDGVRVTGRFMK